jgi:hypothetical protein
MKTVALLWIVALGLVAPVSAGFSEKHLEADKASAAAKGKALVFFFAQAYYNPNCPKCIVDVNANNGAMKKALPRKYANLIMIDAGETRGLENLPQCVKDVKKNAPQLIVTDSACEKVIATLEGRPNRKQADAFEKTVAAATSVK